MEQARRELAEAKLAAYIQRVVGEAPPLSPDQRDRLLCCCGPRSEGRAVPSGLLCALRQQPALSRCIRGCGAVTARFGVVGPLALPVGEKAPPPPGLTGKGRQGPD